MSLAKNYPLVYRESNGQHEFEIYQITPTSFQGQYQGLHGNLPRFWDRGHGAATVEKASAEMRERIGWEHVSAADAGHPIYTGTNPGSTL